MAIPQLQHAAMRLAAMVATLRTRVDGAILAGLVVYGVIAAATGAALLRERQLTLEQAREDATMLAAVMEENTARTFDAVDIALAGLAQHFARGGHARHDAASRALMRAHLRQLPTVRALYVIGPDGFIQHDTDHPRTPDVSLADRGYFRAFLENPMLERHLSEALQSRSGMGWFVASSRRITRPDGSFGGTVVAAVQLDSVSRLYRKLGLDSGRQMSLFQRDGRLLARFPDDGQVGRSYADQPVFARLLPRSPAGVFDTDGPPYSDVQRIVSYRALEGQPLVVVYSVKQVAVLAAWSRAAGGVAIVLVILALLTAGAVLLYEQRQDQRRKTLAQRAAAVEAAAVAERMRALAGELTEADQRKTQFLSTLSHELRNVLGPIQSGMAVLERVDSASPMAARTREIVNGQIGQMRSLVDDLLDVARVNSGKVRLQLLRLDLRDLVAQACAAAQGGMEAAGHVLSVQLPADPLWVHGDRTRLLQVLANLLGNATKYTPAGSGQVRVAARAEGTRALVEVHDNGLGIPPQDLAKVFRIFEQVERHQGHSQGGLGIGLALVARLVALHGGEVGAHSEGDGMGSTFTVSLPLAETEAALAPAAVASR